MNLRKRLVLSLLVTLFMLGSAIVVWGTRTGRFTIFGDQASVLNNNLVVTATADLAKGVHAGDAQTVLTTDRIELAAGVRSGNAVFSVGERDIVAIHRVVPVIPTTLGSNSHVSMQFAGSVDDVSFNSYSPPQPITFDSISGNAQPIDLDFLIPQDSRFVRVKVILERTSLNESPTFGGFTLNYDVPAPATDTVTHQELVVNGSPVNTVAGTAVTSPGKPESLVVTGPGWWPVALATLWLGCVSIIMSIRPKKPDAEGAHGPRTTPGS